VVAAASAAVVVEAAAAVAAASGNQFDRSTGILARVTVTQVCSPTE